MKNAISVIYKNKNIFIIKLSKEYTHHVYLSALFCRCSWKDFVFFVIVVCGVLRRCVRVFQVEKEGVRMGFQGIIFPLLVWFGKNLAVSA